MTTEIHIPRASALTGWRKSSHSGADQGNCVEVIDNYPGAVPVRDSKTPHGPALLIAVPAWRSFLRFLERGGM